MMRHLALAIGALYSAFQAVVCLTNPDGVAPVVGYTLTTPLARSEFMVAYGGLYAGIAVLFALGFVRATLKEGALAFLALAGTATALARLWSVYAVPDLGLGDVVVLLAAEVVLGLIGWLGWRAEAQHAVRATV